ncbi:MAG TPA: hypothetical protein VFO27_04435, partial [Bryobacteraceae bacterium]|nr:hypothetical protein [Bryobacteraceae bacterium]
AGNVPGLFVTGLKPNSPNPGDLDATVAFSPANAGGPNISYDGTTVVSSGVPTDAPQDRSPFSVTFPKAGVYYYECAVHGPDMSGEVVVLPAGAATPETPAQATSRGTALAAADVKNTLAIADAFPINPKTTPLANGGTLHELAAGAPGYHLSVSQFLPMDYTVKRGDTITWDQSDIAQFHTVTFLSGAQAPQFLQIIPQPGGPPKIVLPAAVIVPAGGDTYTGTGIVNSGVLTVGTSFTLKVDAPPGTYQYECLFHADDYNMKGTITVTQ